MATLHSDFNSSMESSAVAAKAIIIRRIKSRCKYVNKIQKKKLLKID